MSLLFHMSGGVVGLSVALVVQPAFVWLAARCVQLDCTLKEAAAMAAICAVLLEVPAVGFLLGGAALLVLFMSWLEAELGEAVVAFSVNLIFESLLLWIGVGET